jgi:hypothetical protein
MIALISCILVSLSFTSRDPNTDLHKWNINETEFSARTKPITAHFRHQSSNIFIIDTLCLVWAIGETILRTLSTPSLYDYFTTLGLFDVTGKRERKGQTIHPITSLNFLGVVFHFIYIYMIGTKTKPRFVLFSLNTFDLSFSLVDVKQIQSII